MTSVYNILSLPKSSNGFSEFRPKTSALADEGSGSPPRKVARLTAESDSASASRLLSKAPSEQSSLPRQIRIIGDFRGKPPVADKQKALLRRCIRIIATVNHDFISQGPLPATYEGIYNACRSAVVTLGLGQELHDVLRMELHQSIRDMEKQLANSEEDEVSWISVFNKAFDWFERQTALLRSILTYLDQEYVAKHKHTLNVHDLAYSVVNERIFGSATIISKLREGLNAWVMAERQTHVAHPNRTVIPALIDHLLRHNQYSAFERQYVDGTQIFYTEESKEKAESLKVNPRAFFMHALSRINEEAARAESVLPVSAWSMVKTAAEWSLWQGRVEWIANTTVSSYISEQNYATLNSMYSLFERVDGIESLCNAFATYIRTTVATIVSDESKDDEMVQRLLDFKAMADKVVAKSFLTETGSRPTQEPSTSKLSEMHPDQKFIYAITDSFAKGFKARRSKPAEMIAKYVDKAMRKGQGKSSDTEFQDMLDKVLALYRFTDDKDVFRTFYHRSLARRLLLEKSASDDFEKAVLKKLKEKYDPEFGMGEEMFKDLALSRESITEYHYKLAEDDPGRKLNAMVLKRSAWPFTAQKHTVDLPPDMQEQLSKYTEFYKGAHTGYVLDWDHSLGTATLKATFKPGVTKELSVSLYQTLVLLLFNQATDIPFTDIKEQTGMEDGELRRVLQSLACGKKKVLKKIPPGRDVDDTDVFRFNSEFNDPHPKIHINSIQVKVSPEESKRTNASIEDDRKHYLDAAIVRLMKARKEMTYEQLKAATIDAVKGHFVPQVETIKKRIDSLVEMEYLERSAEDRSKYKYIA